MPIGVDIIVRSPDSTSVKLIAEAKRTLPDVAPVEEQLKDAMLRLSCPVGLIVTPEKMWIYADQYISSDAASIERIGEFKVARLFPASVTQHFESFVQQWLEDLPRTATRNHVADEKFWNALNKYVLPAIETGDVRAAAPRY